MFTVCILGPATSFKVSTCRCSGSVSVGRIGGNQGKKEEEKTTSGRHGGEGSDAQGREGEGITDGGELGKHGSHYGGDLTESR